MNYKESTASEKLESSQAHAKKALDSTASAAREIATAARSAAQFAYREGKEELSAAARDMGDAARATYSSLAEQTAVFTDQYREKLSDLEVEVVEYVREKPLQAVGIAFGVGLLLGIILNRK
ncbi:MAG: hypothetical protein ACH346_08285 [Chthoniobacterales bacterium]